MRLAGKRFLQGIAKITLFLRPALVSAVFVVPALVPAVAEASFFSSVFNPLTPASLSASSLSNTNSQTMKVLEPAVNLDPNPAKGGGDITVVDGAALLPEAGPTGTLADVIDKPSNSQISVYTVHKGDSLAEIAKMFDVSVNTIVWANDIGKAGVHEGQELIILPITGVRYTVVKGDTVAGVAKKFKADAGEIRDYNGMSDTDTLSAGDVIIIPDGEVTHVAAAPAKKGSKKISLKNPYRGGSGADLGSYFMWPVNGGAITQGLHGYNGIDIGAPKGTEIYAAASGIVIVARSGGYNGGYGSYVVIQHDNGVQTLYGHMSRVAAHAGDQVGQGEVIGYIGATGKATGPHLHFEVRGAKNPFAP